MTDAPRSLPESYWVLAERFLAGEYPGRFFDEEGTRYSMDALLDAGIDTFIDLTHPDELPPYLPILLEQARARGRAITHQRFTIQDRGLPNREGMIATLDAIDAALADGHKVYLHCWGGVGRTGTTVGCYLVRHGKTGREALEQLADWWKGVPKQDLHPRSPETEQQVQFVLDWDESLPRRESRGEA
jgi:hypothetical protein